MDSVECIPFDSFNLENAKTIVNGIPDDRRIVLLGESTHGTEEYYRTRAEITKRLVDERGFNVVVFESDWPFMRQVNEYTHSVDIPVRIVLISIGYQIEAILTSLVVGNATIPVAQRIDRNYST